MKRPRPPYAFIAAVFTIWGGACVYLAWRCVEPLGRPLRWRGTGWAVALTAAGLVPWALIRHRGLGKGRRLYVAALLVMSLVAMLVPVSLARDAVWLGLTAVHAG